MHSTGQFVGLTKQCVSPCWKFHAEDSWSVGHAAMGQVVPNISGEHSPFIFWAKSM